MRTEVTMRARSNIVGCLVVCAVGVAATAALGASRSSRGFIENRGQVASPVLYYAMGAGMTVYCTEQAVVLDLRVQDMASRGGEDPPPDHDRPTKPGSMRDWRDPGETGDGSGGVETGIVEMDEAVGGCAVYLWFEGANPHPFVEARQELAGKNNFFSGSDPAEWKTGVPAFREVIYHEVWPGVDLRWHIEGEELLYEVITRPGADEGQVGFRCEGAPGVVEETDESVLLETPAGILAAVLPMDQRHTGRFRRAESGAGATGRPGERDNPRALLSSTFLGGSGQDYCNAMSVDPLGNPVMTGYVASSDFPTTPGAYDRSFNGYMDVFVAKLNSSGTDLLWSTYLGGSDADIGYGLALDASGNPVLTGNTHSSDFPTTPGAYDQEHNGDSDVFIAKLDASGANLLWSTYLGGTEFDLGYALILDHTGKPLVTGSTESSDFPTTPGAYDQSHNGYFDVFVARLDAAGTSLLGSTFLGGKYGDRGRALVREPWGDIVVTGHTYAGGFPATSGAYDQSHNGGYDVFVAELSPLGPSLVWSTFLGGGDDDYGTDLSLDSSGNVVVTGYTGSTDFPTTPGAFDRSLGREPPLEYLSGRDRL
jgi:hypothetical protein